MAERYSDDTSDIRGLHPPTRNNYFYGKLLDVQHFTMEQRYNNNKRWLLNRLGFGSGVLCGLRLEVIDGQLVLQPGVAIDQLGREIVVPVPVLIDPYHLTDACGRKIRAAGGPASLSGVGHSGVDPDDGLVTICLAFHQCETELVPVLVSDCETREGCAPSTIRETFAVLVQPGGAASAIPGCAVPDLFGPGQGGARADIIDVFARVLGRVDQTCPDTSGEACVVLGDIALPPGDTPLADADVSYTGRQVVLNNQMLFEIILCLWDRVEQCCAQELPATPTPPPATVAPPPTRPPATVAPPPTRPPPTVAPPPPPTVAPAPLLQVREVLILRLAGPFNRGQTLARIQPGDDPSRPLSVLAADQPNAIQVQFEGAQVMTASVLAGRTFVVEQLDRLGRRQLVPGQISPVGQIEQTNTVRFQSAEALGQGRYLITLKGDAPAIMSIVGLPLDGEPAQLPSGNTVEGGDFVCELDIV